MSNCINLLCHSYIDCVMCQLDQLARYLHGYCKYKLNIYSPSSLTHRHVWYNVNIFHARVASSNYYLRVWNCYFNLCIYEPGLIRRHSLHHCHISYDFPLTHVAFYMWLVSFSIKRNCFVSSEFKMSRHGDNK